eukprot:g38479.t1
MGPQARILTPSSPDQHSRRDILLGALDNSTPPEGRPPQYTIPPQAEEAYPLTTTEYTEQDLTLAWGGTLRHSWEQHLLTNTQPSWTNDITEYTTQQITESGDPPE